MVSGSTPVLSMVCSTRILNSQESLNLVKIDLIRNKLGVLTTMHSSSSVYTFQGMYTRVQWCCPFVRKRRMLKRNWWPKFKSQTHCRRFFPFFEPFWARLSSKFQEVLQRITRYCKQFRWDTKNTGFMLNLNQLKKFPKVDLKKL